MLFRSSEPKKKSVLHRPLCVRAGTRHRRDQQTEEAITEGNNLEATGHRLKPCGYYGLLSYFQLCATPWTVAYQVPLSVGFSRQEYWSGLPFPSPGDLLDPGIKPGSPTLQTDALPSEPPGKHRYLQPRASLGLFPVEQPRARAVWAGRLHAP